MCTVALNQFEELRSQSLASFKLQGIPSSKNENYKYTNLAGKFNVNDLLADSITVGINPDAIFSRLPFLTEANRIVLENGICCESLNQLSNLPNGVNVSCFSECERNQVFQQHFSKYVDVKNHSLAALNTSQMTDGIFIELANNVVLDQPLFIVNLATGSNTISHPRTLIYGGKNSKASVCFITLNLSDDDKTFTNAVHEIVVMENASIEFDFFQMDGENANQLSHTYSYQKRDSVFRINTITLGGKLIRNNLNMMLDDVNCLAHLNGLYIGNKKQHIDNQTSVYHAKPNCQSNELYKGILDDESTGVFNGRIHVFKDAQKTNAYQSNKNVLLSDKANMYAKPQLEIYADDVKCSHGATTGQLDDDALFYLRARGINAHDAKALLNFAFAGDVIEKINIPDLKDFLLKLIAEKLHSNVEFEIFD